MPTGQAPEERKNLGQAQKEWAEWVFGEFTAEEAAEVRRDLRRLARREEVMDDEPV